MTVRVRFAPSPTGNLHIGSARTALFNYLFARHHGGKFVLRIEDTDQERSTKEFEKDILEGLSWLGYNSDEPVIYQSQKLEVHKKYIDILLKKELAYKDPEGSNAIFFRTPKSGETVINDLVKGDITFQNKDFKDQVILKSDGSVTYNFAVVIDDAEMRITHIIRGEDHISNTPKQIFFYKALDLELPKFAHIPMILGTDRSKLSKRHGATSINEYRSQGYLPEAINNYLALLGWTPSDSSEVMNMEELIHKFDLPRVSKSNSIFDIQKLNWINKQKIHNLDWKELLEFLPKEHELFSESEARIIQIIESIRDNVERLTDIEELVSVYFDKQISLGDEEIKILNKEETKVVFRLFSQKITYIFDDKVNAFEQMYDKVMKVIEEMIKESGLKKSQILHPLRIALTGKHNGPSLKNVIVLLGKDKVAERIAYALGR